jgi:hypothetical protein
MSRSPVVIAWLAGLLLALLVLLAGATPLWLAVQDTIDWVQETLIELNQPVILVLRAAAIGLALTTVLLTRAAVNRGVPVRGTVGGAIVLWLIVVVGLQNAPPGLRWGIAALIAFAATLSLSRRTA